MLRGVLQLLPGRQPAGGAQPWTRPGDRNANAGNSLAGRLPVTAWTGLGMLTPPDSDRGRLA